MKIWSTSRHLWTPCLVENDQFGSEMLVIVPRLWTQSRRTMFFASLNAAKHGSVGAEHVHDIRPCILEHSEPCRVTFESAFTTSFHLSLHWPIDLNTLTMLPHGQEHRWNYVAILLNAVTMSSPTMGKPLTYARIASHNTSCAASWLLPGCLISTPAIAVTPFPRTLTLRNHCSLEWDSMIAGKSPPNNP